MSVPPYPVDERQHLQIPDPDNPTQSSTHFTTPFINPHDPHFPHQPTQDLPYPPQQSLPINPDGDNFRESLNNLQLNEGLQDLGRNLLKQGKT